MRAIFALLTLSAIGGACTSPLPSTEVASPTSPVPASPVASGDLRALFIAITQAPDRTMHMDSTGLYTTNGATPFTSTFDFSGDDYAGNIESQGAPGAEMACVDGVGYHRIDVPGSSQLSGWQRQETCDQSMDPLRGLAVGDLDYMGHGGEVCDGFAHIRVRDMAAFRPPVASIPGGGGVPGPDEHASADGSSFDICVNEEGTPVDAALTIVTRTTGGDLVEAISSELRFSDWGSAIEIVAPPLQP